MVYGETIADRIDDILSDKKMSRRELALKAGIPPSTFQAAMARGGNLSSNSLIKISHTLNISADYILGLRNQKDISNSIDGVEIHKKRDAAILEMLHKCIETIKEEKR